MKQIYLSILLVVLALSSQAQKFSEKELLQKLDADLIELDKGNGDGTFSVRHRTTKKWGMYQLSYDKSMPVEMIPKQYDSIDNFGLNAKFTTVYNNGKKGIYLCYFDYEKDAKQTVPCIYEAFKKMIIPYSGDERFPPISYTEEYLAAKKNGKWGWVNWFTGEVQSEFIYDSVDELPKPTYSQEWI